MAVTVHLSTDLWEHAGCRQSQGTELALWALLDLLSCLWIHFLPILYKYLQCEAESNTDVLLYSFTDLSSSYLMLKLQLCLNMIRLGSFKRLWGKSDSMIDC